jgi:hypothetical protein
MAGNADQASATLERAPERICRCLIVLNALEVAAASPTANP